MSVEQPSIYNRKRIANVDGIMRAKKRAVSGTHDIDSAIRSHTTLSHTSLIESKNAEFGYDYFCTYSLLLIHRYRYFVLGAKLDSSTEHHAVFDVATGLLRGRRDATRTMLGEPPYVSFQAQGDEPLAACISTTALTFPFRGRRRAVSAQMPLLSSVCTETCAFMQPDPTVSYYMRRGSMVIERHWPEACSPPVIGIQVAALPGMFCWISRVETPAVATFYDSSSAAQEVEIPDGYDLAGIMPNSRVYLARKGVLRALVHTDAGWCLEAGEIWIKGLEDKGAAFLTTACGVGVLLCRHEEKVTILASLMDGSWQDVHVEHLGTVTVGRSARILGYCDPSAKCYACSLGTRTALLFIGERYGIRGPQTTASLVGFTHQERGLVILLHRGEEKTAEDLVAKVLDIGTPSEVGTHFAVTLLDDVHGIVMLRNGTTHVATAYSPTKGTLYSMRIPDDVCIATTARYPCSGWRVEYAP